MKAENNVLDSVIHPRADVSSVSSHAAASRRLMRSMVNIDDEALKKLVGKASEAHTNIVHYLSQQKSQENNVDMITPPGSPGPSTSSKFFQPSNRRNSAENAGKGNNNKLVAIEGPFINTIASPNTEREVLIVTDEEYIESSDDETENEPSNDAQLGDDQLDENEPSNDDQMVDDQLDENENKTDQIVPDPDDSDDQILLLDSLTADSWGVDDQ